MWRRSRCTLPLTIISRLLKSWATPPVNWPIACSCCAWRSAPSAISRRSASSCRRWVRRSAIHSTANSNSVAGRPKIRCAPMALNHSWLIAAMSMPDKRINRVAGKLAKADAPRHAVDLGIDGECVVGDAVVDGRAQPAGRAESLHAVAAARIARQDDAVVADQGIEAAAASGRSACKNPRNNPAAPPPR